MGDDAMVLVCCVEIGSLYRYLYTRTQGYPRVAVAGYFRNIIYVCLYVNVMFTRKFQIVVVFKDTRVN